MKVKLSRIGLLLEMKTKYEEWYDKNTLDKHIKSRATRRGHKHIHSKTYLSKRGTVTPAVYRHTHMGVKLVNV